MDWYKKKVYAQTESQLPPGFEGFGFDEPTKPAKEDPNARFRRGLFFNLSPQDTIKIGSQTFVIERVFSPYEAMAAKSNAIRRELNDRSKKYNIHQELDQVNVRPQKGSSDTTMHEEILLSDTFDNVVKTIQYTQTVEK